MLNERMNKKVSQKALELPEVKGPYVTVVK